MLTNNDVMRNLHQVVDTHAIFNDRVVDCTPIDCRIRANFDIVADDHAAQLRHLDPAILRHCVAETVCSDHGAGVHDTACTERDVLNQRTVCKQVTVIAHPALSANNSTRTDDDTFADDGAFLDHGVRTDLGTVSDRG